MAKTYDTDPEATQKLLASIFDILQQPDFEIAYFTQFSENIKFIIQEDPPFAAQIYLVIFGHTETSNDTTEMGTSVLMRFSSTRRQDYELCYYRLENVYADFLLKSPELAIRTGLYIVNRVMLIDRLQWPGDAHSVKFDYQAIQCEYIPDYSVSWSEFSLQSNEPVNMVLKIITYLDELLLNNKPFATVLHAYIGAAKVALTWELLLKLGSKYPATLGKELFPLITIPAILGGIDTSFEARDLIGKTSEFLSKDEIKAIEETIFKTYQGVDARPNTISMALSRIPVDRLQLKQSKHYLALHMSSGNVPPNSNFFLQ